MRFTKREVLEREMVQLVFENARSKGLTNPEDYFYMQTKPTNGQVWEYEDYFKHRDTKEYISYKR